MESASSPAFELDGKSLALDFANTWEDRSSAATDKLGSYPDLVAFATEAGIVDRAQAEALAARARDRPAAAKRAKAAADGREFVTPDDVKALAHPVLEHRMALRPEAQMRGTGLDKTIETVLASLRVPSATRILS